MYEVKRESVGQYTGLTDRDGAKIFEGDIISYNGSKEVVYFDTSKHIVIGNIYDNSELLRRNSGYL